jgi:DNA mismatch endonuclease (patch repair protein)
MADVFSKRKRSEVMSRIRSRGNKDTELALARLLRANGISGWRRHVQVRIVDCGLRSSTSPRPSPQRGEGVRVRPDFVFPKFKLAVFVDGCFWHGCPKHATWPAHRAAWWRRKIEGNKTRDRLVNRALRRAGWRILRIWECELRFPESCIRRILEKLRVES